MAGPLRTPPALAQNFWMLCRRAIVATATLMAAVCLSPAVAAPAQVHLASLTVLQAPTTGRAAKGFEAVIHRRALAYAPMMDAAARRHGVDPLLLHALTYVETGYRPEVRSRAGAMGLMQVLPGTARRFGVKDGRRLMQPEACVQAGAGYMKWLLERFDNDLTLAVAAYNAGEGAVERFGNRVPPYRETRAYVRSVLARYEFLRASASRVARDESSPRLL
jgi:soluble lytic murein transglycosylase-like protein